MQLLSTLLAFASSASAIRILLANDDSWASANVRATFSALTKAGHDVVLVGPALQQSGTGGTFNLPATANMTVEGEFGTIPVGAPIFGHETGEDGGKIWYFDGSPAATAAFAIDVITPMPSLFGYNPIDLVVTGPNEGTNLGPFTFTLSGTLGAAYFSVERGIPAVAFSAGNSTHRSFTTNTGSPDDPANLAANVVVELVTSLIQGVDTNRGERILPLGVGLTVNLPTFGPDTSCTDPDFVLTRLTGGATINKVTLNATTGIASDHDIVASGLNTALSGNSHLPGETPTVSGCHNSISVFSVDYDAPTDVAAPIQAHLKALTLEKHPSVGKQ